MGCPESREAGLTQDARMDKAAILGPMTTAMTTLRLQDHLWHGLSACSSIDALQEAGSPSSAFSVRDASATPWFRVVRMEGEGSAYEEIKLKGQRLAVLDAKTGAVLSLLRWISGPNRAGEVIVNRGGEFRALMDKSRADLYGTDSSVFSRVVPGGRDGMYLYYNSGSKQPLFVVTQRPAFGYLDLRFVFAGAEHILLARAGRFDDAAYAWNEYDLDCAAGVDALQVLAATILIGNLVEDDATTASNLASNLGSM
jgi:hypothetical protein